MNDGLLYGVLTLTTNGTPSPLFSLFEDHSFESGNHIWPHDPSRSKPFDYQQGGEGAEFQRLFVSTRGMTLTGHRIGEPASITVGHADSSLSRVIQNLLAINRVSSEEEQRMSSYLQLAYSKVFTRIQSRCLLSIGQQSSQPKFIIITNGIPVYFWVLMDKHSSHLVWTNEASFDERVRDKFGEHFYLFKMPTYSTGVCVLQSNFLDKRVRGWNKVLGNDLKVMNALEAHLNRRWLVPQDPTVNGVYETDHLVALSQPQDPKENM